MKQVLEKLKKKDKISPCNENKFIKNGQVKKNVGLTENAKILME
jgi:hypothetical protein